MQKADESKPVKKFWLDDFMRTAGCGTLALARKNCLIELLLNNDTERQVISANYVYPTTLKSVSLPAAKITVSVLEVLF